MAPQWLCLAMHVCDTVPVWAVLSASVKVDLSDRGCCTTVFMHCVTGNVLSTHAELW
eukprot:m.1341099 g.1341099  ORF g.1341099 m.1341099 type:complete len:57 (+) comp24892_c1_seq7:214-384(+)